jgi:hypothetical protein
MKIYIDPESLSRLCYNKAMYELENNEQYWIEFLNILGATGYEKDTDVLFLDEGYYIRTV